MNKELLRTGDLREDGSLTRLQITLLAGLLLLSGAWIYWDRTSTIVRAYSSGAEVVIAPVYVINRFKDFISATASIVTAAGLARRAHWGWAVAMFYAYWRLECDVVLPMANAAWTDAVASFSATSNTEVSRAVFASVFFLLLLYYLMRPSVMAYFQVPDTEKLRANAIAIGLSFPIATGLHLLAAALRTDMVVQSLSLPT